MDRMLIADDHEVVQQGLARALSQRFSDLQFDFASTYGQVKEKMAAYPYALVILDLKMDNHRIFDGVQRLMEAFPESKVMVYSAFAEETFAHRLLKMGVYGFVSKSLPMAKVVEAVAKVMDGEHLVSSRVFHKLMDSGRQQDGNVLDQLSDRELEILIMLVNGNSSAQIADKLHIHTSTVGTYKHRIYTKLGTSNLADITLLAIQHHLLA